MHCPCCQQEGEIVAIQAVGYSSEWFANTNGNQVFQCTKEKDHRFWRSPLEPQIFLHQDKFADEESIKSEQDWVWTNKGWMKKQSPYDKKKNNKDFDPGADFTTAFGD